MNETSAPSRPAEILAEYGPFPGVSAVHGVTHDGSRPWIATGATLQAIEPAPSGAKGRTESGTSGSTESGAAAGATLGHSLPIPANAGSAFDGKHFYQLCHGTIQKIDPESGRVISQIPSPAGESSAGMSWAEGALWISHFTSRQILKVDPETGAVLKTLDAPRNVTGITFVDDQLWHGTWQDDESDIRRISKETGQTLEILRMPAGTMVSGLEYDGKGTFYAGGGPKGVLRAVRAPGVKSTES